MIDDIRPARIHANVPENFAEFFEGFAGADIRDEANGRKSVRAPGCSRRTSARHAARPTPWRLRGRYEAGLGVPSRATPGMAISCEDPEGV